MSCDMRRSLQRCAVVVTACLIFGIAQPGHAQSRVSDKDVEALMNNLRDDAHSFRPRFSDAIKHSTIRKTSREKDANNLVEQFENQTKTMLDNFKRTKKGDDVPGVVTTANQVNSLVYELKLNPQTTSLWEKIRAELSQVANAVGVAAPNGSAPISSSNPDGPACDQAVGTERSRRLVDECMQVSPATHPPCNAKNSCALIIDEIKRGCGMLTANVPAFCNEYH